VLGGGAGRWHAYREDLHAGDCLSGTVVLIRMDLD